MMRMTILTIPILLCGLAFTSPAWAQQHSMPGMDMQPAGTGEAPSTVEYRTAMAKMHHDMDIIYSGKPERDFVLGMIPHHQGAIDMAKVMLKFGKDAETRQLAQGIIAAQEKEIAQMRRWLAKHPG